MIDNIIAVDFDGTLCTNRYPDIGEPIQEVIDKLLEEQKNGAKLILWTCRCDKELTDAVEWCGRHGIIFDAVNDHIPEMKEVFGNNTRKIFAHQYWDDRAVNILTDICSMPELMKKAERNYFIGKIRHLDEENNRQERLIKNQKAEIDALIAAQETLQNNLSKAIKEFVENVIFEIVNKPSEFSAEQVTADFLSGSAHRQIEIIDIIEKMAGVE